MHLDHSDQAPRCRQLSEQATKHLKKKIESVRVRHCYTGKKYVIFTGEVEQVVGGVSKTPNPPVGAADSRSNSSRKYCAPPIHHRNFQRFHSNPPLGSYSNPRPPADIGVGMKWHFPSGQAKACTPPSEDRPDPPIHVEVVRCVDAALVGLRVDGADCKDPLRPEPMETRLR